MRKTCLLALLTLVGNGAYGQDNKAAESLQPMPRNPDVELALSALPPHLREGATVYVIIPAKDSDVATSGTNEVQAYVVQPRGRQESAVKTRGYEEKQTLPLRDTRAPIPFRSPF